MTAVRCTKCETVHDVDFSDRFASMLCEACRKPWGTGQRAWMAEKHKEMVKKRTRVIKRSKR